MSLRVQKVSEPKVSGTSSPAFLGTWCFSPQTLSWQWGNQLVNSFALRNLSCPEVSPPSGQIRGWRSGRGGLHFKGETKEYRHKEVSVMWKNTGREFINSAQVGIIQLLYQSFRRCLGCQELCHLKQNQPWNLFSRSHVTAMHKWYSCFLLLFDASPPKCSGLKQPQSFNYISHGSGGWLGSSRWFLLKGSHLVAIGQHLGLEPSQASSLICMSGSWCWLADETLTWLQHLHVVSPSDLGFFTACRLCPKRRDTSCMAFYDPASEATRYHFHHILVVEVAQACLHSKKKDIDPTSQWDECQDSIVRTACRMRGVIAAI